MRERGREEWEGREGEREVGSEREERKKGGKEKGWDKEKMGDWRVAERDGGICTQRKCA